MHLMQHWCVHNKVVCNVLTAFLMVSPADPVFGEELRRDADKSR